MTELLFTPECSRHRLHQALRDNPANGRAGGQGGAVKYFDHGGGVARMARELGLPMASILDFSASINPLGMPPEVLRVAREALTEAVYYPEIDASSLTAALAEYHDIPAENILPGAVPPNCSISFRGCCDPAGRCW